MQRDALWLFKYILDLCPWHGVNFYITCSFIVNLTKLKKKFLLFGLSFNLWRIVTIRTSCFLSIPQIILAIGEHFLQSPSKDLFARLLAVLKEKLSVIKIALLFIVTKRLVPKVTIVKGSFLLCCHCCYAMVMSNMGSHPIK